MGLRTDLRRIEHEIASCRYCGERHVFGVLVQPRTAAEVPIFGGPSPSGTLAFSCPTTGKLISEAVTAPPNFEVVGPDDPDHPARFIPDTVASPNPEEQEYTDWIKASRATALDFCKTMLTAATGAVPIYFAVIKYLGSSNTGSLSNSIAALPPLLFLATALVFSMALRPHFTSIRPADFPEFRTKRLRQLQKAMLLGVILFATGMLLAIAIAGIKLALNQ